jgi:hypothetical protein
LNNLQVFDNIFNGKDVPPSNVYINGSKVPGTINYRNIKLTAHEEIAIAYGRPPDNYTFCVRLSTRGMILYF